MSKHQSGKFKAMSKANAGPQPNTALKPLCPTRWSVCDKAICAVLRQYENVLTTLEEVASSNRSDSGTRAYGLLERFNKGKTIIWFTLASEVIGELVCLNKSLQKQTETVSGIREAIEYVRASLQSKRNEESLCRRH